MPPNLAKDSQEPDHRAGMNYQVTETIDLPSIVQLLYSYRIPHPLFKEEDENFNLKAIESLVKKLKDNPRDLENLVSVICGAHDGGNPCICISRTLDGRLQINGRKGFPHIIFTRIWRFPFLPKNQLVALPICKFSHDSKSELVCVNPYHYDIAQINNNLPSNEFSSVIQHNQINNEFLPLIDKSNMVNIGKRNFTAMDTSPATFVSSSGFVDQCSGLPFTTSFGSPHYISPQEMITPLPLGCPTMVESSFSENDANTFGEYNTPLRYWCTVTYHEFNLSIGEMFKVPRECRSFIVDGYFNTNNQSSRYSLGQFTNIHRNSLIERTRMYIGPGIEVSRVNDNEIYLHCRSLESVFVESEYLDLKSRQENGPFVHKIYHDAVVKIMDLAECYSKMLKIVNQVTSGNNDENQIGNNQNFDIRRLFTKITRITRIRLSFVKGWGPDYPRREIHETPCWIDLNFFYAVPSVQQLVKKINRCFQNSKT